ncbi:glutaredoxin family protein [Enterovibrio paralichthyis]|uniref:glutaredoxin family protein n=1 Tax=Enterovibrio paralichthyis TaxID=2853805 RepID=UPI0006D0EE3C|nr:glutaredoxin family protein [Enterovibrio paralichthyis]MBV7296855.1 thioredoxin family protein [Enterovibrio paralichthyis]
MALVLYSTEGCHLCEEAMALYEAAEKSAALRVIDIAFDDTLFERYGVTIPVLSLQNSDNSVIDELGWPFDSSVLQTWLAKHGID